MARQPGYSDLEQWLYDTGHALPGRVHQVARTIEQSDWFLKAMREKLEAGWREGFIANTVEVINGLGLNPTAYAQAMERLGAAADARNPYRAAEKIQEG